MVRVQLFGVLHVLKDNMLLWKQKFLHRDRTDSCINMGPTYYYGFIKASISLVVCLFYIGVALGAFLMVIFF